MLGRKTAITLTLPVLAAAIAIAVVQSKIPTLLLFAAVWFLQQVGR